MSCREQVIWTAIWKPHRASPAASTVARVGGLGERTRTAVREHGVKGVAKKAVDHARRHVRLHEEHVWYELKLAGATGRVRPLDEGLVLRRAYLTDEWLHDALGRDAEPTAEHLRSGDDLWFVMDGDTPAFSCYIERGESGLLAAPNGRLALPPATVCLEDSITSPDYRGRGLAPSAWTTLAAELEREGGLESMITKVAVENVPSRKAVIKAGFEEVALMTFDSWGPRRRTHVEVYGGAAMGQALRDRLTA